MTDFWQTVLDFAQATTARVGSQLLKEFGQVQATQGFAGGSSGTADKGVGATDPNCLDFLGQAQKADGSLVTQADQWADREIREAIAATFPGHGILSEEGEHIFFGTEWCWVIDPLDGTTNFTRGIPIWAISLGLLYQGVPVFGYVYLPPLGQTFHGYWDGANRFSQSNGAFLNHHPIHTSADSPSNNHFFSLCSRSASMLKPEFPCKFRMLGVASYNFLMVAAGATLGGVEATPKIWDIAAVWVIVQAAGGVWISLQKEPFPMQDGAEYGDRSYPTLVVSHAQLVPVFQPFMQ
ncbi:MAG: inositol monophosphatase family protein [Chroococcidiopsidaceae cyanobacterium CP_BM_ER_R8_30]|nr:inositol monophosphatase family protein [Chroococcidiopsidaceae cyanobacterium CP_BM_ER_R8_30]